MRMAYFVAILGEIVIELFCDLKRQEKDGSSFRSKVFDKDPCAFRTKCYLEESLARGWLCTHILVRGLSLLWDPSLKVSTYAVLFLLHTRHQDVPYGTSVSKSQ
jgi:hypothetical protein